MLIGLVIYLSGRPWLPASSPRVPGTATEGPQLTRSDWSKIALLIAMLPVLALSELGNQQIFNTYLVWGDAQLSRTFFGFEAPVTWLLSVDAIVSTAMLLAVVAFWRWWSRRHREPDEIVKLTLGAGVSAFGPLFLAAGNMQAGITGQKVSLAWAIAFHLVNDLGYALLYPVGLALYSRAAPRSIAGLMIGVFYLHLFLGNMAVGRLGGFLEPLGGTSFWLVHSGLMTVGCGILLIFTLAFRHLLAPTGESARG
jgi:POT family proton-dependent oligopeptide transporter